MHQVMACYEHMAILPSWMCSHVIRMKSCNMQHEDVQSHTGHHPWKTATDNGSVVSVSTWSSVSCVFEVGPRGGTVWNPGLGIRSSLPMNEHSLPLAVIGYRVE